MAARPRKPATSPNGAGRTPATAGGRELRARGRRTRQRLLDAGVAAFSQRGYHAARVDDIVKLARTSHGTFYLYFANKEDLFRALAEDVSEEMRELAESVPPIEPGPDGLEALQDWLTRFADVYAHYGPVIRAWTEAEIGASEFGRLGTDLVADLTRALLGRIGAACPPDIDPATAAIALVAMIERANYYVLSGAIAGVEPQAMIATLAATTHAALFGAGVPAR
jgi:AcrR family transcriptional regulator